MIDIAIFDERPLILAGLEWVISNDGGMMLVGSARHHADFRVLMDQHSCSVAVVGLSHREDAGLQLLEELRGRDSAPQILAVCMFPWEDLTAGAIRAGASGCVTDHSSLEEILTAIRELAEGRPYFSPSTAASLVMALRDREAAAPDLSPRQTQVLRLFASGKTITDIAEMANLSVRTVSTYKTRIMQKLKCCTNAELIAYAIRNNFV